MDCAGCNPGRECVGTSCCLNFVCGPNHCGNIYDGCGGTGTVNCGTPAACTAFPNSFCDNPGTNQCQCTPETCASVGATCGSPSNDCGGTLNCGSCTAFPNSFCNASFQCACTPNTCASLGATCGTPSDGCGGTLNCGTCTAFPNSFCNASNQCACTPSTCASLGLACGPVLPNGNNCGGPLNCGMSAPGCTFPNSTCNASNQCVCTPSTCGSLGFNCGNVLPNGNNCGGPLSCGSCGGTDICVSNVCQPAPTWNLVSTENCGDVFGGPCPPGTDDCPGAGSPAGQVCTPPPFSCNYWAGGGAPTFQIFSCS